MRLDIGIHFCLFCMNYARQYEKTTTLSLLKEELEDEYMVFSISFEGIGKAAVVVEAVV